MALTQIVVVHIICILIIIYTIIYIGYPCEKGSSTLPDLITQQIDLQRSVLREVIHYSTID